MLRAAGALGCAVVVPGAWGTDDAEPQVLAALREGGVAVLLRHASAPGTFDPPEFRLGDCGTQRNLDAGGREQARRIGAWFRAQGLAPAAVRSSPWCRCLDTARLAFGDAAQAWPALGSVRMAQDRDAQASELRRALAGVRGGGFEVWVTHQFTIGAVVPTSTASGEGVVLRAAADGGVPQIVGRLAPAQARATAGTACPALPIMKTFA